MREYPWSDLGLLLGVSIGYFAADWLFLDQASVAIITVVAGVIGLWTATLAAQLRFVTRVKRLLVDRGAYYE